MPEWITPLLIALASGGLLTGFAALFNSRNNARKDETESLRATIVTLQEENARIKTALEEITLENRYYRRWAERLCYQIISLGGTPCSIPRSGNERESQTEGSPSGEPKKRSRKAAS